MPSDKERLDWVLKETSLVRQYHGKWEAYSEGERYVALTVRQAIDAAMKAEAALAAGPTDREIREAEARLKKFTAKYAGKRCMKKWHPENRWGICVCRMKKGHRGAHRCVCEKKA